MFATLSEVPPARSNICGFGPPPIFTVATVRTKWWRGSNQVFRHHNQTRYRVVRHAKRVSCSIDAGRCDAIFKHKFYLHPHQIDEKNRTQKILEQTRCQISMDRAHTLGRSITLCSSLQVDVAHTLNITPPTLMAAGTAVENYLKALLTLRLVSSPHLVLASVPQ